MAADEPLTPCCVVVLCCVVPACRTGLAWMAAGSTRSVFHLSFARDNNIADVTAKGAGRGRGPGRGGGSRPWGGPKGVLKGGAGGRRERKRGGGVADGGGSDKAKGAALSDEGKGTSCRAHRILACHRDTRPRLTRPLTACPSTPLSQLECMQPTPVHTRQPARPHLPPGCNFTSLTMDICHPHAPQPYFIGLGHRTIPPLPHPPTGTSQYIFASLVGTAAGAAMCAAVGQSGAAAAACYVGLSAATLSSAYLAVQVCVCVCVCVHVCVCVCNLGVEGGQGIGW